MGEGDRGLARGAADCLYGVGESGGEYGVEKVPSEVMRTRERCTN